MTVWPWTYNVSSNNVGFLSGCDGVTTDDMQWVTNMVKYLTVAENTEIEVGGTAEAGVKSVAYGNKESVINGENLIVKVLAGEDVVKIENGTVTGVKAGTATVLYGYKAKTTNGSPYVVYAQPATVTVTAGASSDDNNGDVSVNDESSAPVDGEEESFALIIIVVIVAAVAAGVAAFFVVKKKKQ
jgi:hypothetical protein